MWVEIEVRRQDGWVAPTCRIVFVLTLKAFVAVNWRKQMDHRWTVHTECMPVNEDDIVSGGEWPGPC